MILPILTVVVTVSAGAALALAPRSHGSVIGHIRTFALTAAGGVVLVHFLPEALEGMGLWALLLTAAGLAIPHVLERSVSRVVAHARSSARIGLEAGYAGLLAHKVGDGFALAAAEPQGPAAMVAIGAHTIPVVAFVVLAFGDTQGRRAGLLRALWLALASVAGILSYRAVAPEALEAATPIFDSLVAGLLLHIVAHELGHDLPDTARARALDIGAAAAGLAVIGVAALFGGGHGHGHGHDAPSELAEALLQVALANAPALLLALTAGALFRALAARSRGSTAGGASALGQAARGLWRALPASLCSCRVLAATRDLGGASIAFKTAFVLGAPALAIDGVVLTAGLFGIPFALGRAAAGVLVALTAALVFAAFASRGGTALVEGSSGSAPNTTAPTRSDGRVNRSSGAPPGLAAQVFHLSAWVVVGLLLAAQIVAFVPPVTGGPDSVMLQALGLGLIALLSRPCLPAAALVSAALAEKGVAPGALLVALVVAPVLGAHGLTFFWRVRSGAALILAPLALAIALALGLGLDASGWLSGDVAMGSAEPSVVSWAALVVLAVVAAQAPWRAGLRGWLAAAFELDDPRVSEAAACGCRSHTARTTGHD